MGKLERQFQSELISELRELFPGCIIMKNDPTYLQGVPDLAVLYHEKWALLEVKQDRTSSHQPNQDYYVDKANKWSFASFIYPENKEAVLNALRRTFRS